MRLKVSLLRCNGESAIAELEGEDGQMEIVERSGARAACLDAAAALRVAAAKFERLADEPGPYMATTQERINRFG